MNRATTVFTDRFWPGGGDGLGEGGTRRRTDPAEDEPGGGRTGRRTNRAARRPGKGAQAGAGQAGVGPGQGGTGPRGPGRAAPGGGREPAIRWPACGPRCGAEHGRLGNFKLAGVALAPLGKDIVSTRDRARRGRKWCPSNHSPGPAARGRTHLSPYTLAALSWRTFTRTSSDTP